MDLVDLHTIMAYSLGMKHEEITQLLSCTESKQKLLEITPIYINYKTKMIRCLEAHGNCSVHLQATVETELQKLEYVVKSLEVIMFKIAMGNLEVIDSQLERLAGKYASDQLTLCEIEKSLRLIEADKTHSSLFLQGDVQNTDSEDTLGDRNSDLNAAFIKAQLDKIPPPPKHIEPILPERESKRVLVSLSS